MIKYYKIKLLKNNHKGRFCMKEYMDCKQNIEYERLKKPASIIKKGGIVVFPTETVYGIGTNGLDEKAIENLYKIKQRPLNKPISLLVNNIKMIDKIAKNITKLEYTLIKEFFPGPLTIILNKKDIVPNIVTSNSNMVGIRMPANEIALKLIEYAKVPIATPSANISGKPSGVEIKQIMKDFEGKVDCFIDNGTSKIGISSTIVQVIKGVPHILRQGSITKQQIENVLIKNI